MSKGKNLILFGPGKHFGLQVARRFAAEGFHIILVARNRTSLDELAMKLGQEGFPCTVVVADVCKSTELQEILAPLPSLEVVIFNVKSSVPGDGLNLTPELLTETLAANVSGALSAIQACMPLLQPSASILLTGGGYKDTPDPEKLALSVSKGALHTLFLSMIEPLKWRGIILKTVVIDGAVREDRPILPSAVAEAFWKTYQQDSSEPTHIS